jgi:protein involved in polysaccharide export with SLBB domain
VVIGIAIWALVAGGCASTPEGEAEAAPSSAPLPALPAVVEDYVLRYGDVLDIRFFYNPELNTTVPIRPDGWIVLELVGEVKASGLSPAALSAVLRDRYADKLRNPEIAVILTTFSDRRIFVGGEVAAPRAVPLDREMTAFQAIIEAGGFKPTAHLGNIVVLRDQGTAEPIFYTLDFARTVKLGEVDPAAEPDLVLQPNDIVFVPKTRVARWGQLVDQYVNELVPISLSMGVTYYVGSFTD